MPGAYLIVIIQGAGLTSQGYSGRCRRDRKSRAICPLSQGAEQGEKMPRASGDGNPHQATLLRDLTGWSARCPDRFADRAIETTGISRKMERNGAGEKMRGKVREPHPCGLFVNPGSKPSLIPTTRLAPGADRPRPWPIDVGTVSPHSTIRGRHQQIVHDRRNNSGRIRESPRLRSHHGGSECLIRLIVLMRR